MDNKDKKAQLSELMDTTMSKIREMVDSNSIIGQPITTPDGVTLIPISSVSFAFGSGGSDYGKTVDKFGGGGGAGVRINPVAFLIVKDGVTRVMPVAMPAYGAVERVLDMVPEAFDRVESFIAKRKEEKEIF